MARDISEDRLELEKLNIPWIDLVCVDLYPLSEEIAKYTTPSAGAATPPLQEGNTATAVSPPNIGGVPAAGGGGGMDRHQLIKQAANWCLQDFSAMLNVKLINPQDSTVKPETLAELIKLISSGKISGSAAKQVFKMMFEKGGEPLSIIDDLGLHQVSDESAIESAIDKVIADNQKAVADYKAGQEKSFGFLVGQTMKELKGKGNPQVINQLLKKKLSSL
jgi:hypothetical protein